MNRLVQRQFDRGRRTRNENPHADSRTVAGSGVGLKRNVSIAAPSLPRLAVMRAMDTSETTPRNPG